MDYEVNGTVEFRALMRDIIALVRSSGSRGQAAADDLQLRWDIDGAPLLGGVNAMEDVKVIAPPDFERRLRAMNDDGEFDEELEELVESQERLRQAA